MKSLIDLKEVKTGEAKEYETSGSSRKQKKKMEDNKHNITVITLHRNA